MRIYTADRAPCDLYSCTLSHATTTHAIRSHISITRFSWEHLRSTNGKSFRNWTWTVRIFSSAGILQIFEAERSCFSGKKLRVDGSTAHFTQHYFICQLAWPRSRLDQIFAISASPVHACIKALSRALSQLSQIVVCRYILISYISNSRLV